MSSLRRRGRFALPAFIFAALFAAPTAASAADVPPGATWTEATIPSSNGVKLHADILRPSNLPADKATPVILSIGPYFAHAGQTGPAGPVEGTSYDPVGPSTGPSDRFLDFVEGADLTADALGEHGVPTLAAALRAIDSRRADAFLDVELKSTDHGCKRRAR